jgi:hypothetical protein
MIYESCTCFYAIPLVARLNVVRTVDGIQGSEVEYDMMRFPSMFTLTRTYILRGCRLELTLHAPTYSLREPS